MYFYDSLANINLILTHGMFIFSVKKKRTKKLTG